MVDSSRVPADLAGWDPDRDLGQPGEFPFTRGIQPTMYRGRLWTMRQYAGLRHRQRSPTSVTGTCWRRGSPDSASRSTSPHKWAMTRTIRWPRAKSGRVGVAIDTLDDMAELFDGIPLDRVSTSMTINSTAIILLAMYVALADAPGVPARTLSGTVQNDILKEYLARGTYIYPPHASLRLVTDIFAFCERELPQWNPISVSGYHITGGRFDRGAGGGIHAGERHRLHRSRPRARAVARIARRAHVLLLCRAQRLSRRDRQVPRGAPSVGPHHEGSFRRVRVLARSSSAFMRRRPAAR